MFLSSLSMGVRSQRELGYLPSKALSSSQNQIIVELSHKYLPRCYYQMPSNACLARKESTFSSAHWWLETNEEKPHYINYPALRNWAKRHP